MEKKMKYPYIGINEQDTKVLFFSDNNQTVLFAGCSTALVVGCSYESINPAFYKNITHEYLQNTYGEVVSPEHAELIIELAELHGFTNCGYSKGDNLFFFKGDKLLFIESKDTSKSPHCAIKAKQITIPLPPKADKEEHSSKPIKIGDEVETNLGLGHIRLMPDVNDNYIVLINGHHIPVNTVNVKKLEAPKQELSELPLVGDEVVAVHENNSLKGKLLALTKKYAIISQGCGEQHLHLSAWNLEKPKAPEEDLFDIFWGEVAIFMNRGNLDENSFKRAFLRSVNKKPQQGATHQSF